MESMDSGPDHEALVEENERLKEEVAVLRKFISSMQHVFVIMEAVEKAPPETEIVEFNTRSLLAAPLEGGGRVLRVIELLNKRDNRLFSLGDQTLLSIICGTD